MKNALFILASLVMVLAGLPSADAQPTSNEYDDLWFYRVWFNEKTSLISDYSPDELLSPAALARREKYGIPALTESDLPVSRQHINTLSGSGLVLRCTSRWLNTALFSSTQPKDMAALEDYEFIDSIRLVKILRNLSRKTTANTGSHNAMTCRQHLTQGYPSTDTCFISQASPDEI